APVAAPRRRRRGRYGRRRRPRCAAAPGRSRPCPRSRRYNCRRMELFELDYELPPELIAQHPADRRHASRLLLYGRGTRAGRHPTCAELPEELQGALLVVNDTKVVPARIPIASPRGEVLLLERLEDGTWEALARPTRRLRAGRRYGSVELLEHLGEGR